MFSELQATDFDSNICGNNDLLDTGHIIGPKNDKGKITFILNNVDFPLWPFNMFAF